MAFLQDATKGQLIRAVADNHRQSIILRAQENGGEVYRLDGVTWVYNPKEHRAFLLFPKLVRAQAGEQLDEIVRVCRRKRLLKSVMCWSLLPTRPVDLGVRLAARGFDRGWQPHWMALDVAQLRTDYRQPENLEVRLTEDGEVWDVDDIPYYSRGERDYQHGRFQKGTRRWWHFGAFLDGRPVGHCSLFVSGGRLGVGGIYGTGVSPAGRRRGIGRAVTLAACAFAKEQGCNYTVLNATGHGVPAYASGGFVSLGYGQTWFLNRSVLKARLPSPKRVALIEAVGRGDVKALNELGKGLRKLSLNTPLQTGETLVEFAVRMERPGTVSWLADHGATLDVMSAWRLGWRDRISELLADHPELANWHFGRTGRTPLHEAAAQNNVELARLVLDVNPDLSISDGNSGTPIHQAGWSGNVDMVQLLIDHGAPLEAPNPYGGTPLSSTVHGAVHSGQPQEQHYKIVQALLKAGADVNGANGGAIRYAAMGNLVKFVRLFLKQGADAAVTDPQGRTALDLAQENGHSGMVRLLKRHIKEVQQ